ncbi:glycosyltransferase family 2 protein [Bacillus shivajii]|uniref:glycosyltransferase n=1 Tax=Bacillus shivajii TaxID=1983719 RepID=UPI001CF94029|nr:glycosyltransferase [Bacillus shivajii]UCZ53580.1 glycosyltransferase family 2 protein [Bacillus shivajii]
MANNLFILSLTLIWVMLLYHMFLMQGGYFHFLKYQHPIEKWRKQIGDYPSVSVLIPAHNEEIVIERTLKAMVRFTYPKDKLEVVVINDQSNDQTGELARNVSKQYPFIKVVDTQAPYAGKGKATALNYGLKASTGEVIVVYDADNTPERSALNYLVLGLNTEKIGAVVGKFRVINAQKNLLTKFINIETIGFQWLAQAGRWFWFKITTIPGTNFAIRRSILEELGGWDHKALAEDTELSIRVYNLGYHIRFFPAAITWEQEPENWKVWWKQRTRWARGNQYVILKFLKSFFKLKRKNIIFDLLYFFFTYFLFLVGVMLSNTIFIVNLFYDLNLQIGIVALILWVLAYLLYITEAMIALSIEKTEMTAQNFFVVALMYFTYSQLWILLVIYSFFLECKRTFFKQEVKWDKTKRFTSKQSSDTNGEGVKEHG